MFKLFRKKNDAEPPATAPVEEAPVIQEPKADVESTPTKTTVGKDAPKKTNGSKGSAKKGAVKRSPAKKESAKKAPAKKTAEKNVPANKESVKEASKKKVPAKKGSDKKIPVKKASSKKAPAKAAADAPVAAGTRPKELKGFEKELKDYAQHSRMPFSAATANQVFTEYMAKTFRELGYKMVLMRDQDNGLITMLDRDRESKGAIDDSELKSKIVVKCVYMKKGSVGAEPIISAQEEGARNRGDETWCITTTDFGDDAVRKSKKSDARVRLYNGQRLYKEFLSKNEKDR